MAKYAEATHAEIALVDGDGTLRFSVTDDGRGFDTATTSYDTGLQGIGDRLAALDGSMDIASQPGRGTTVTGGVPIPSARVRLERQGCRERPLLDDG